MLSRTVIQGKTPPSWKMKIRLAVRPSDGAPRGRSPRPGSGSRKPPMALRSVVLPQPDGPTMQTNSPARTPRSIVLQDVHGLLPGGPAGIGHPEVPDLDRESVAGGCDVSLGRSVHAVNQWFEYPQLTSWNRSTRRISRSSSEPDRADDHHPRDHQVIPLAGVPGVDDQIAQPGVDRDHLGGHHHQPGHPQRDPDPGEDLRERSPAGSPGRKSWATGPARSSWRPGGRPAGGPGRRPSPRP